MLTRDHSGNSAGRPHCPRGDPPQSSDLRRCRGWDRPLGDDEIGASLEPFHELRKLLGLVGEVGLHRDHRVTPRVPRARGHRAAQGVERPVIADVIGPAEDGEGQDVHVRLQRFRCGVGAAVVVHQNLVLARVLLEHLADAPEQNTDRLRFVVRRYADVQHRASKGSGRGRLTKARQGCEIGVLHVREHSGSASAARLPRPAL